MYVRILLFSFTIFIQLYAFSQDTRKLTGVFIIDDEPLAGINFIVEQDYENGTQTDLEGRFELMVPSDRDFILSLTSCICTSHHDFKIKRNDQEVLLTLKKCKPKKKVLKKVE